MRSSRNDISSDLLNLYIQQYNDVQSQITFLQRVSEDIRRNINVIVREHLYRQSPNNSFQNIYNDLFRTNSTPIEPPSTGFEPQRNNSTRLNRRLQPVFEFSFPSDFFESVTIRPTTEEINRSTRVVAYNEITNPINETCPISMHRYSQTDIVRQIIECGHIFMPNELLQSFERDPRCPVCRYDIRNYRENSNNNINENNSRNFPMESDLTESEETES
tara:strand:- start:6931 stop:7584 length:654 start_codon:yes stop_codon:yes gene_type:complete